MLKSSLPLILFLFFLFHPSLKGEVEPSLEKMLPVYFIWAVSGAGNAQILKEGENQWQKVAEGSRLEEGDRILAGEDTEVILSLRSETLIHLDEETELIVTQLEENSFNGFICRLQLLTGSLLSDVNRNHSQTYSQFEVDAGGVVCRAKGTLFEVSVNGNQIQTYTDVGVVQVNTSKGSEEVKTSECCFASKGQIPSLHSNNLETKTRFQVWRTIRQKLLKKLADKETPPKQTTLPLHASSYIENRLGPMNVWN